jgi:monovalent cation/hydrogen antiporter
VVQVLVLLALALLVSALARRRGWSAPLLLVLVGVVVSFVPGVPVYELDPDLVLLVFLPPLLYWAAWESSYLNLRQNLRAIGLLSVGLVLFTAFAVGYVMHSLVPGLGLAAALALGAIVAPPDAVAATAIGREMGLPRRLITILAGESLINDATALTAYRVAVSAAMGGGFSLLGGIEEFGLAALGGAAIGLVGAVIVERLVRWLRDPLVENGLSLLTPFACYLAAEEIHASGVIAVVVAGLFLGHRAPRDLGYATRLQAESVWRIVSFGLESIVFLLIGLQVRAVAVSLSDWPSSQLLLYSAAIVVTVIVVRFAWVFPATYLPRRLSRAIRERDPAPPWQWAVVVSWAGMRGVVSLAAAFALPIDFPQRDLILFLTFVVVIATLVGQGFTLPKVIRRLGVTASESLQDNLAEADAQQRAARAAIERLDQIVEEEGNISDDIVQNLRDKAEIRTFGAWERLGGGRGHANSETPTATYRRLRRAMLEAERDVFVQLRDDRRIDDEVLRRVLLELDLEEAMLARD